MQNYEPGSSYGTQYGIFAAFLSCLRSVNSETQRLIGTHQTTVASPKSDTKRIQ